MIVVYVCLAYVLIALLVFTIQGFTEGITVGEALVCAAVWPAWLAFEITHGKATEEELLAERLELEQKIREDSDGR